MESSTESVNATDAGPPPVDFYEIFGPKNRYFNLIHITAVVCLGTSMIVSIYTLIYLLRSGEKNVFKRRIGECASSS